MLVLVLVGSVVCAQIHFSLFKFCLPSRFSFPPSLPPSLPPLLTITSRSDRSWVESMVIVDSMMLSGSET